MVDESPAPYQSLYRRYRPRRFDEVLGQDHVTRALRNAVRDHRVAHAYLFSGPRGTGKTSTARILAMALNCEAPEDGEPDGTCGSCEAIRTGASVDVHELDAASNRKLDEMRDLLSRVALGTSGRQKVYIIDEVHQLTADAASALLKTLEEPPSHVVFVLATTDPQKVLPTIRSRTQHYEFRLLGTETLAGLLNQVNDRAGLGVPSEAIDMVVRRGRGSARDALSVLDQVAALGGMEDEATIVSDVVDAIAQRDAGRVLVAVAEAVNAGRDPRRLTVDLLEHLRNGFLATESRSLVLLADDAALAVEAQARQLGLPTLVRALEELGRAAIDMRDSVDARITLEVALVRLATPAADSSSAALAQRMAALEAAVAGDPVSGSGLPLRDPAAGTAPAAPPRPTPATPPPRPAASDPPPAGSPPGHPAPARSRPGGHKPGSNPSRPDPEEAPPMPPRAGADKSASRPALGAHRRTPPPPDPPIDSAPPPPIDSAPTPAPDPPAARTAAPTDAAAEPALGATGGQPPPGGGPTRDDLTTAWGDRILGALRPGVRVYFAPGRFVAVEDGVAVFALPDRGLLSRARPVRAEVEAALASEFGRTIPLRLVMDDGAVPVAAAGPPPDDPSAYDLDTLEDAGPAVVSPEQRLMQAFPGAEEVTP